MIMIPTQRLNSSIQSIDGTLTGSTTPSLSGPWNNNSEEVFHIPQSSITGASPSDSLVSYPSTEVQLVYSTVLVDRVIKHL